MSSLPSFFSSGAPWNWLLVYLDPPSHQFRKPRDFEAARRISFPYANGRLALIRAPSESCTSTDLASLRFRFGDLHWSKCLRPPRVRTSLPVAVTLKRLATDLRVLLRAMGFGMGKGEQK
jgi:hypothetical protein